MYKILFIAEFDWQPMQSAWGAWDIASPYADETHNGWMLPDGWQSHLTERGVEFEEVEVKVEVEEVEITDTNTEE